MPKKATINRLQKKYDVAIADFIELEAQFECLQELDGLIRENSDENSYSDENQDLFSMEAKNGRTYSPTVRKRYYALLASQITPCKITAVVKNVLSAFFLKQMCQL